MAAHYSTQLQEVEELAGELGIDLQHLVPDDVDAVVLPAYSVNTEMVFQAFSKEIERALTAKGLRATLYNDARQRKDLIQKSADVILPVVLYVGSLAVAFGVNVLSSWVYDRFLKDSPSARNQLRVEYAELDMATGKVKRHVVEGSAPEVHAFLCGKEPDLEEDG